VNTYRRVLRAANQTFPHWVALPEERCVGENYYKIREFCRERELSLSRHGHSVTWHGQYFQVFMFAEEAHAEVFSKAFGGERMHPSEKGKGKRWSSWKKGTYKPKPKSPYDFSD
jgi:hypothetical protein